MGLKEWWTYSTLGECWAYSSWGSRLLLVVAMLVLFAAMLLIILLMNTPKHPYHQGDESAECTCGGG